MKFTEKDPDFLGLGLSRHWEGALLGVLAVFIASLLCWGAGFSPFTIVFFAVSSVLPAALIGSLLISKKNDTKILWCHFAGSVYHPMDISFILLIRYSSGVSFGQMIFKQ